jgi:hypothetical protein
VRFAIRLLTCLLFVASAVACNGGSSRDAHQTMEPGDTTGSVQVTDAMLSQMPLMTPLSDFQRELLSDGVLSLTDYETAYVSLVDCMSDAGWILSRELRPTLARGHSFHAYHPSGDQAALSASRGCRATFVDGINWLWIQEHRFTEEDLQAARNTMAACLRDAGVASLPTTASKADIQSFIGSTEDREDPRVFVECQIRIELEHGVPDFGG